jgi:hypothetical protein
MPIHESKDSNGYYFQWGYHGKKYYYSPTIKQSRINAYNKSLRQARAIYSSGYKEK